MLAQGVNLSDEHNTLEKILKALPAGKGISIGNLIRHTVYRDFHNLLEGIEFWAAKLPELKIVVIKYSERVCYGGYWIVKKNLDYFWLEDSQAVYSKENRQTKFTAHAT
jgi:hypothetical protein